MWTRTLRGCAWALVGLVAAAATAAAASPPPPTPTLAGKFVAGFQGWFKCPGDGRPGGGWVHWFAPRRPPDAYDAHFDFVPDWREWPADALCRTGLVTREGQPVFLYSDQYPDAVLRQFTWMQSYGIDAAALQRFVVGVASPRPDIGRPALDRVLDNVRRAAEATGRGFFVMYDISGADPATWAATIEADWRRLIATGVVTSANYQRHRGRPVLGIAGMGHPPPRPATPEAALALLAALRRDSAGIGGVTILGLGPTYWRSLRRDALPDAAWDRVYRAYDIISPWTVGRFRTAQGFAEYMRTTLLPDMAAARAAGVEVMPVIYPGYSAFHLARDAGNSKPANGIPRDCGRFYEAQAEGMLRAGATMLYGAMFDEVDEGTALYKLVADSADLPAGEGFVALDADGCREPDDYYLRLTAGISARLKRQPASR